MCFLLLSDITKMSTCTVNKIQFKVVGCTSWEDGYHPKNMEVCQRNTSSYFIWCRIFILLSKVGDRKGTIHNYYILCCIINFRYCLFPQQVVLDLKAQIRIRKLQLLSHEYMIGESLLTYNYVNLSHSV